jgi:hypothetical protein
MNKRQFISACIIITVVALLFHQQVRAAEVTLTVKVLDEKSSEPIMGAHVTVIRALKDLKYRESNLTDENGLATFVLPEPGLYYIEASAPEYDNNLISIELTENASIVISIHKSPTMGTSQIDEFPKSGSVILAILVLATMTILLRRRFLNPHT